MPNLQQTTCFLNTCHLRRDPYTSQGRFPVVVLALQHSSPCLQAGGPPSNRSAASVLGLSEGGPRDDHREEPPQEVQGSAQSAPALPAWKGRMEPTRQGSLVMQGVPMGSSEAHAGGGPVLPAPTVRSRPQVHMLDLAGMRSCHQRHRGRHGLPRGP